MIVVVFMDRSELALNDGSGLRTDLNGAFQLRRKREGATPLSLLSPDGASGMRTGLPSAQPEAEKRRPEPTLAAQQDRHSGSADQRDGCYQGRNLPKVG